MKKLQVTIKQKVLTLFLFFTLSNVTQAQIAVDVDINIGDITILYAYTDIDVDINATALGAILASGCASGTLSQECDLGDAGGPVTAVENAGDLEAPFNIALDVVSSSSVNLILQNVWAVRAIGGTSANTTVSVVVAGGTTITNGASSIAVSGGSPSPATFADPGLGSPQVGDVSLTLDFTNLTLGGNHNSTGDTGDTVYTIEVTGT